MEWRYGMDKENLYHNSKKIKLNLTQLPFLDWIVSVAYKNKNTYHTPKIICSNL